MRALYDATDGNEHMHVGTYELANSVGIDRSQITALVQYLEGEYLIQAEWDYDGPGSVSIAHPGVLEVEQALRAPDLPTEHFAPLASVNITNFYGDAAAIQIAQGCQSVKQTMRYDSPRADTVRKLIEDYRAALGGIEGAQRGEAEQKLDLLETEINKPDAHPALVEGLLGSLRTFAQNAIASAGAGAVAGALASVVANWPF